MKKFFTLAAALSCVLSLAFSFGACGGKAPGADSQQQRLPDAFLYDYAPNQSECIISGIEKENGDGILEIPEEIDGKPVTQILSLDYRPNDEETSLHVTEIKRLSISKTVKTLSPYLCHDMLELQEVVFSEDSQIENLEGVFQGCKNLHYLHLPTSLKQIYAETFEGCETLTSLTLPKNVENVSAASFKDSGLTEISVDLENPYYCAIDNVLYNKEKTELIYYPAQKSDEEFTAPNNTLLIGGEAFKACKNLKRVDLKNVTKVERAAFDGCENISEIKAEQLRAVDETPFSDTAWYKNYQGGEISLGKVLLSYTKFAFDLNLTGYVCIAPYAFQGHEDLHRITFDTELTTIGDGAFKDCVNLYAVIFQNQSRIVYIGQNVFENNATNCFIKVYEPLYNEYAENVFWQTYKDNIKTFS